jgi:hypothetical membrane protein
MGDPTNASRARRLSAGLLWIAAGALYFAAEFVVAQHFRPQYSYAWNYISDLGVLDCGVVVAGRELCSPLHDLWNTQLVIEGVAFLAAFLLLLKQLPTKRRAFLYFAIAHTVGIILVAFFPGSLNLLHSKLAIFHGIGAALGIFGGNIAQLLSPVAEDLGAPRPIRLFSKIVPVVGLAAALILLAAQIMQTVLLFPPGIWERMCVDSIMLWEIGLGAWLLITAALSPPARR